MSTLADLELQVAREAEAQRGWVLRQTMVDRGWLEPGILHYGPPEQTP